MDQVKAATKEYENITAHANEFAFIELSPIPCVLTDNDLRIIAANSQAVELLGVQGTVGHTLSPFVSSSDEINAALANGHAEIEINSGDIALTAEIFARQLPGKGWLIAINDISERRRAERTQFASDKQKWKIQRTEALERLAGGIAHEFNNYLAVILLQTDMINLHLPEDDPIANRVNEIKAVANDAASVVRQLLAFGRRQSMNPAPLVLNTLFAAVERDLKALVGGGVAVEFELEPELGVCFVDQSQLMQAMMYLTMHAREKMPEGGKIKFRTTNIAKGGPLIHRTQSSGSYIQIEVSHTGTGIDARNTDNIFEPFFSTKGSKENAGLALATVYGIVKQSGGYIWVTSPANSETTFKIQFPRIDEPKYVKSDTSRQHGAAILLIDDEGAVRRVAAEALRGAGYRVIEAASGEEAVELARTISEPFKLILADYSMPRMNGEEACRQVKDYHTDAKVMFMSGDPASLAATSRSMMLSKPFSVRTLVERVSEALSH
jgi:two-component system, cell cycle sensor histidine kinase and response regulator CckA